MKFQGNSVWALTMVYWLVVAGLMCLQMFCIELDPLTSQIVVHLTHIDEVPSRPGLVEYKIRKGLV